MTATFQDVAKETAFDYIIVGGGTAGLTLAARLSEDPNTSVLVLEAGEANIGDPNLLRPASFGSHFGNKLYAWAHKTIAQKHANNRESPWDRGKGLGGSSGINFLCWTKPPARDVDDFERLGNPGWNWNHFEQYVARTEGFVEPSEEVKKKYSMNFDAWKIGRQGPLQLAYPATINAAELRIQESYINAGLPVAPLPLSGDPTGVFLIPLNYNPQTHTRSYSTTAFYLPNKNRPNFTVMVTAHVNKILFNEPVNGDVRATGVTFEHSGKIHVVHAKREVILSAGSLKSPQLLELSGIGRKDVLEKINVPSRVELSGVGENVQEHLFVQLSWELKEDVKFDTLDLLRDPAIAAKHLELHTSGSGLYTTGIIGFAFAALGQVSSKADELYQSIKAMISNTDFSNSPPSLREQYQLLLERFDPRNPSPGCEFISFPGFLSYPNPPEPGKRYITIFAAANHLFSRGTIHSTSADPMQDPEFDPRYFEKSVDLDVLVEMCKFARQVVNTAPFKDMVVKELNPGLEVQTDEQWREWIKPSFSTTWHTSSSCSMLPREKGGVVDSNLKVYGTENLRVVDLSVMPLQVASHPQAVVYGIAEQAADIIKGRFSA